VNRPEATGKIPNSITEIPVTDKPAADEYYREKEREAGGVKEHVWR
jgi:hypothetical protein